MQRNDKIAHRFLINHTYKNRYSNNSLKIIITLIIIREKHYIPLLLLYIWCIFFQKNNRDTTDADWIRRRHPISKFPLKLSICLNT
jgi:hypothetical protein